MRRWRLAPLSMAGLVPAVLLLSPVDGHAQGVDPLGVASIMERESCSQHIE
jgi:hypothetical protein